MLREIRIRNFVLIDDLQVEFDKGFNVLTGETGAGKSIVVDALSLLMGERASSDVIRTGADEAVVEAVFDQFDERRKKQIGRFLELYGLEADPDGLFVKRVIRKEGRGRCYLNSSPTQLKVLEKLGSLLVDIHGQHEHQSLLFSEVHRELLDAYGGLEPEDESVREKFMAFRKISQEISRLEEAQRERRREEDHLKFQVDEIEKAEIKPGEEEELEKDRRLLQHAEKMAENSTAAVQLLVEGSEERPALMDGLAEVQRRLQEMAEVDPALEALGREVGTALIQLEEVGREVTNYSANIEIDPQRLEQAEERFHLLKRLKQKYGATLEEVLKYYEETRGRIEELDDVEENLSNLAIERDELMRQFIEEAVTLSQKRQKAAVRLSRAVTRELKELGMPEAQFMVQVDAIGEGGKKLEVDGKSYRASSRGIDKVEFMVNANPGQELGPMKQIASGGEISRIALAIKTVLAEVDRVGCLVFDEIDSGIGGNIAEIVGQKFREVAKNRQVICVTHLPQIAGKGQQNFLVDKLVEDNQTRTAIEKIEGDQLVEEIARMLGDEASEDSQTYAKKLIGQS
jgi:DNA repair protein RecN (Recombination protein N)